jgi:integrase
LYEGIANWNIKQEIVMGVEVTRKKNGSLSSKWWYGRFTVEGKPKCMNLGVKAAGTVPSSLKQQGDTAFERSRMRAQLKLDELKKEAVSQKAAEHHLKELYEIKSGGGIQQIELTEMEERGELLPAKRKRSAQQTAVQKANIRRFREYIQENHPQVKYLSQVSRKMALAWVKYLKEVPYSGASHNIKLSVVRSLFEQVAPEAGILSNPFAGIPYQPLNTIHRKPFTEVELAAILNHANKDIRPVIITGMCTAMRRGDCCLLKWEAVDLESGFINVKTSKTGEYAEIPLFQLLRKELERRSKNGEYVFPEAAAIYIQDADKITAVFKQALKDAEITDTHVMRQNTKRMASVKDFHSLRTTWITMALIAGVPMELVRRVTGHSTVNIVLKHYFHPGREDFREALETALPEMMTGRTTKKKSPTARLKKLIAQAGSMKKKELVRKIEKILDEMAA